MKHYLVVLRRERGMERVGDGVMERVGDGVMERQDMETMRQDYRNGDKVSEL